MFRKSQIFLIILLISAVLIYLFYPTDKKRIRRVISGCAEAVEAENSDMMMEYISYNYRDSYGGSYLYLKKRVDVLFKSYDDFEVKAEVRGLLVEGKTAEVKLKVNIIVSDGAQRGYLVGDGAGDADIIILLEKSPYEWKIIGADWGEKKSFHG